MGFQARISAPGARASIVFVVAFALAATSLSSGSAAAQGRASAAALDGPAPASSTLLEALPASITFAMHMDVDAVVAQLGETLAGLGVDSEVLLREGLRSMVEREMPETLPFDPIVAHGIAAGGSSADTSLVLVFDDGVALPDRIPPEHAEYSVHVSDRRYVVGSGDTFDAATDASVERFNFASAWPAGAAALQGRSALGYLYLADRELMDELDREFHDWFTRAGVTRFAVGVDADASWTFAFDTSDPERLEQGLARMRALGTSGASSTGPGPDELDPFFNAFVGNVWDHLTLEHGDGVSTLHAPAPSCGGLTAQFVGFVASVALYFDRDDAQQVVDAEWTNTSLPSTACDNRSFGTPTLPWSAAGLLPADAEPGFFVVADFSPAFRWAAQTFAGFSPHPVDIEALRGAFADADEGELLIAMLDRSVGFAFAGDDPDEPVLLVADPLLDDALEMEGGFAIEGLGQSNLEAPSDFDVAAALPTEFERARAATPALSPFAVYLSAASLVELVGNLPTPVRGATTTALTSAAGAVVAVDDGALIVHLLGVDGAAAPRVQEHLRAVVSDGVDVAGTLPNFSSALVQSLDGVSNAFTVEPADDGIVLRIEGMTPLFPVFLAGAGRAAWALDSSDAVEATPATPAVAP